MEHLKRALALNAEGVSLLATRSGVSEETAALFKNALSCLKKAVLESGEEDPMEDNDDNQEEELQTVHLSESSFSLCGNEDGGHFMFARPLLLEHATGTSHTKAVRQELVALCSAAILFNFALSQHHHYYYQQLQSQPTRLRRERALQRAARLYQSSLDLLFETCGLDDDDDDDDDDDEDMNLEDHESLAARKLAVFVLNNKALIHYEQCEFEDSTLCMMDLSHLAAEMEHELDASESHGLFVNLLLLTHPKNAAAA